MPQVQSCLLNIPAESGVYSILSASRVILSIRVLSWQFSWNSLVFQILRIAVLLGFLLRHILGISNIA